MTPRSPISITSPLIAAVVLMGSVAAESGPAYRRVLDRELERAQTELEATIEIWEDHSTWENAWRVETEHYVVRTTHSRYLGVSIAEGLEVMLGHYQNVLGTDYAPGAPFRIDIHPDQAAYNTAGENAAEHSSFYGSFFAAGSPGSPVAVAYHPNEISLKMLATHGAVHQYLASAFPAVPPTWISEGLASYFAYYWAPAFGAEQLRGIASSPRFIRLSRLLGADLTAYQADPGSMLTELGMFFTYLLHYREDTRMPEGGGIPSPASFAGYLQEVLNGGDVSGHPFEDLLRNDLAGLEEGLRNFRP